MRKTNIRSLDLNLLIALKALLEEKHVSRAAEKIELSQPAMSRALGRLRKMFNDPLLVRSGIGLDLTSRALEIYEPLQTILSEIDHIITPTQKIPSVMKGEIIIATRDNEMVTILPKVISRVTNEAPKLILRLIPIVGDDLGVLERQEADFVMTAAVTQSGTLFRQILYRESFYCLISANNSVLKKGLDLENYLSLKHCIVSTTGYGRGIVDNVLVQHGLEREVVVYLPNFLAASHIVANSNLIVTVPKRVGMLMVQEGVTKLLEPPIKIPSFPIYLYWHARNQNNFAHQWIRKIIKNVSVEVSSAV